MALDPTSTFPDDIDDFPVIDAEPPTNDRLNTVGKEHDLLHNRLANAIIATQTEVLALALDVGGGGAVTSVNGQTGPVTLIAADVGAVAEDDSRLTNARTPTAHATSHQDGGTDELALDASQIVSGFLSDDRIPVAIARDSEVTAAVAAEATARDTAISTAINNLIAGAPGALNTLLEITDQLATDESAVSALTTTVGGKLAKASNLSDLVSASTARTNLGLGSVDNTADTAKPVSTAQQTALNLKANLASPTFTGTVTLPASTALTTPTGIVASDIASGTFAIGRIPTGTTSSTVPLGGVITAAGPTGDASHTLALTYNAAGQVTAVTNNAIAIAASQVTSGLSGTYAPLASPTFTGTVTIPTGASITAPSGLVKADVGLGSVDNTADSAKPISTLTQAALDLKQPLDSDLTTLAGLTATTDSIIQSKSSAWTVRTPAQFKTDLVLVKADVGLGSVDNTADTAKPVSTAQQTALDLKANLAGPTFTGTTTIATLSVSGHATLEGVTSTGATGTGSLVFSASPTLTGAVTVGVVGISAAGAVAGVTSLTIGDYSAAPHAFFRRATGSLGSEVQVLATHTLADLNWQGWNNTNGGYLTGASINAVAEQDFTTTGFRGTKLQFLTAPSSVNGGVLVRLIIDNAGKVYFGSSTSATTSIDQSGNGLIGGTLGVTGTLSAAAITATTIAASSSVLSSSPSTGIGYATGAGGTVTQGSGSGKATAVTLSKITGEVTTDAAALGAATNVTFVLTNTAIGANDLVAVEHLSGGTAGAYIVYSSGVSAGSCSITIRNTTAGSLSQAIVLKVVVIKAVTS